MAFLDKLWDDTVAGPPPESGLGRLRKHNTFTARSTNTSKDDPMEGIMKMNSGSAGEGEEAAPPKVTRSIMIKRPAGCPSPVSGTPPSSPAGSISPLSPFSSGARGEWNRFRRKSLSDAYERAGSGEGTMATGVRQRSSPPPFEV